jgi:hypothetical protein
MWLVYSAPFLRLAAPVPSRVSNADSMDITRYPDLPSHTAKA